MISAGVKNAVSIFRERGIADGLAACGRIARWVCAKRVLRKEFLVCKIHDYKMLLSLREPGISEALNLHGGREAEHVYIIEKTLKEGMCVFDIGGNIGYYTLMAAKKVGPRGKVYAVEPAPNNVRILKKNVELNGFQDFVEVQHLAISNSNGTRHLHLSTQSNLHSFHDDVKPGLKNLLELNGSTVAVNTMDLATFIKSKRKPDFLRMDVEGHEVEILEHLASVATRENWFPTVLFETHSGQYDAASHDIAKPLRALFALGYKPKFVASNREPATGFQKRGYRPTATVQMGKRTRGIYENISPDDALAIIQEPDQSRCVLLSREN